LTVIVALAAPLLAHIKLVKTSWHFYALPVLSIEHSTSSHGKKIFTTPFTFRKTLATLIVLVLNQSPDLGTCGGEKFR
jgi:hypothetical protein